MRGTPSTWARSSSAERRGESISLRVKKPVVHSRIRRTVHASGMAGILGRLHSREYAGPTKRARATKDLPPPRRQVWLPTRAFVFRREPRPRARALGCVSRIPVPSPGTPGEGWGGGLLLHFRQRSPHPRPPPEYREREQSAFRIDS